MLVGGLKGVTMLYMPSNFLIILKILKRLLRAISFDIIITFNILSLTSIK